MVDSHILYSLIFAPTFFVDISPSYATRHPRFNTVVTDSLTLLLQTCDISDTSVPLFLPSYPKFHRVFQFCYYLNMVFVNIDVSDLVFLIRDID